jgi:hypothetical protein
MTDLVQLQNDVTEALLACEALANVNVVQYRKLRISGEIDWTLLPQGGRNGKNGAGILVNMPEADCRLPNTEGPQFDLLPSFLVVEIPEINMDQTGGTMLSAEEIAQWVLDCLHLLQIDGMGQLAAAPKPIAPSTEFTGCVCYRVNMRLMNPRGQTIRVGYISGSFLSNECTLSCITAGATIYYTTDGTFPGSGNTAALVYSAPFTVTPGTVVRAAAYKTGFNSSRIGSFTAP